MLEKSLLKTCLEFSKIIYQREILILLNVVTSLSESNKRFVEIKGGKYFKKVWRGGENFTDSLLLNFNNQKG